MPNPNRDLFLTKTEKSLQVSPGKKVAPNILSKKIRNIGQHGNKAFWEVQQLNAISKAN